MIYKNEIKISEIIEVLREAIMKGDLESRNTGIYCNALRKYYELTTALPDKWENAIYNEQDFERRMGLFKKNTEKLYKGRNTVYAYKSRARSAILLYEKISKNKEQKEKQESTNEVREIRIGNDDITKSIKILNDYLRIMESLVPVGEKDNIYTEEARNKSTIYLFPVKINKIASIMLPKNINITELGTIKTTVDSILTLEQYKILKKGGSM